MKLFRDAQGYNKKTSDEILQEAEKTISNLIPNPAQHIFTVKCVLDGGEAADYFDLVVQITFPSTVPESETFTIARMVEGYPKIDLTSPVVSIRDFAVLECLRGQGIGAAVMDCGKQLLKLQGREEIVVCPGSNAISEVANDEVKTLLELSQEREVTQTDVSNRIEFYKKCGFSEWENDKSLMSCKLS